MAGQDCTGDGGKAAGRKDGLYQEGRNSRVLRLMVWSISMPKPIFAPEILCK